MKAWTLAVLFLLAAPGCTGDDSADLGQILPRLTRHPSGASTAASGSVGASGSAEIASVAITASHAGALYVPGAGSGTDVFPSTVQLSAVVTLGDGSTESAVAWTSGNSTCASVAAGGLVTAGGSPCDTTITALATDGISTRSATYDAQVSAGARADVAVQ